ncbi:MAG: YtxH domain-containing protein [Myxococcota bacterium]
MEANRPTKDDILEYLGLQTRKSAMDYAVPALGIFAGGVAFGAALGLLLAPKPGSELREELARRAHIGHNGDTSTAKSASGSATRASAT